MDAGLHRREILTQAGAETGSAYVRLDIEILRASSPDALRMTDTFVSIVLARVVAHEKGERNQAT